MRLYARFGFRVARQRLRWDGPCVWPVPTWQAWASPEDAGWSLDGLARVRALTDTLDTAAFMVVQGGRVVDAWGDLEARYSVHSIRKSFVSALYGIQVERGAIQIGKTLAELGIDDREGLTERERQATVMHLLMARSGVYHPCTGESAWMRSLREPRGSHGPGTHWIYNNWDFNALGTIYDQETGEDMLEAFRDRIAMPLGMEDYRYDDEVHDAIRAPVEQSVHPMYAFRMSARDLARFGLLYLREGRWGEASVVPRDWVRQSVLPYSDAGGNGAYGYLWWVSRHGIHWPHVIVPEGTFSARGVGGHRLVVIPRLDLVIVHRVDTSIEGREVTATQFGRLLALLLDAAPAPCPTSAPLI
jgi:CubicO group peptidase (beta-lactamase class C family)